MRQLLILIIIPTLIFGQSNKKSLIYESIKISDSESINFSKIMESLYKTPNKNIANPDFFSFQSPGLIRSFETITNNASDFNKYINRIQKDRNLGYWNILTNDTHSNKITSFARVFLSNSESQLVLDKIKGFKKFYESLFDNKKARSVLFEAALDITLYWCKKLPRDFTEDIIEEVEKLKQFAETIKNESTENLSYKNHDNLNSYWEGFIVRRMVNNNVTADEVIGLLTHAENKINKINLSKLNDALYKLSINKKIDILIYRSYYSLYNPKSKTEVILSYNEKLKEIKHFKDKTSQYYVFITEKDGEEHRKIYDQNLSLIK